MRPDAKEWWDQDPRSMTQRPITPAPATGLKRRDFLMLGLGTLVGGVSGIALASSSYPNAGERAAVVVPTPTPKSEPKKGIKGVDPSEVDVLEEIKKFELQSGKNTLSLFETKQIYLPLVAEYFRRYLAVPAINVRVSAEEILENTFIIRRDFADEVEAREESTRILKGRDAEVLTSPPVRLLSLDYPDMDMTPQRARTTLLAMAQGALAWVVEGKVFIVFDRVNNARTAVKYKVFDEEKEYPLWQFRGYGYQVKCEPSLPAAKLRSVYLHELIHWAGNPNFTELSVDMVSSYQRVDNEKSFRPTDSQVRYKKGDVRNFIASFEGDNGISKTETGLNEFVTDYLAARLSIFDDLPYTLGYHGSHSPAVFENFSVLLDRSRISEPGLFNLQRGSRLRELMLRFAAGAQNIAFSSDDEKLDFAIRNFLHDSDFDLHYGWKRLRPHYPGLDTTEYKYYVDLSRFQPVPGLTYEGRPDLDVPPTKAGCI